jgi:hypothetical protein
MAEKESEISQSWSARWDAIGRARPEYCQIAHAVARAEPLTPSPSRSGISTTLTAHVRPSQSIPPRRFETPDPADLPIGMQRGGAGKLFRKWQLRRVGLDRNLLHHQRSRV